MDPAAHDRAVAQLAHLHAETDRAVHQWIRLQADYRDLHTTLSTLPDKVSHTVMVPFGPLAFMPGKLVHTNEITVMLGDNWFAERSARQAVGVVERRLKVVDGELEQATKDRDALAAKLAVLTGAPLPGTSGTHSATPTADVTEDGLPIMEIRETEDDEPAPAPISSAAAPADVSANLDAMFQTMRDLELKVQSGAVPKMSDEDARFLDEAFANVPDDDDDEDDEDEDVEAVEALPLDAGNDLDPDSDASAIMELDPDSDADDVEVPPLKSSLMPSSRRGSGADKRVQFAAGTADEKEAGAPAPLAAAVAERAAPTSTSSVFGHVMERHVLERTPVSTGSTADDDPEYDSGDDVLADAMHQRELVQAYHTTRRRLVKSMLRSRDDADFHGAGAQRMNFRTPLVVDEGRDWREEVVTVPPEEEDEVRRIVERQVVKERVAPAVVERAVPVVRERVAPGVVERAPPAAPAPVEQEVEQEPPRRVSKFRQQRMQRGA